MEVAKRTIVVPTSSLVASATGSGGWAKLDAIPSAGNSATALDARTIQVRVPSGNSSQVRFLADIQNIEVNVTPQDAKVIINSRTGSVVMNREVTLDSCAVAQGNLSITVNRQANVSQPDTPFGGGQTVVTPQTQIDMRQSGGSLQSASSCLVVVFSPIVVSKTKSG